MKQGDLRGVDIKICISPQDPHVLLGRNTRVRLNISSFVSCDVLGLAYTPPYTLTQLARREPLVEVK